MGSSQSEIPTIFASQHILHATDKVVVEDVPFVTPEVPARADAILEAVRASRLGSVLSPIDYGLGPILDIHSTAYITFLRTAYRSFATYLGKPQPVMSSRDRVEPRRVEECPSGFPELIDYYTYDYEDPILEGTWEAAYWSAQAALTAAASVRGGRGAAYALCRPPGHHAERERYGGFCYLNNAAVAARWLTGYGSVAILDVDYHHGNGTQAIFYRDPDVFTVSLHVDPAVDYPYYWGYPEETGEGPGKGTNMNLPLPIGADDRQYGLALSEALRAVRSFDPAYLVVSMGLDAVSGDPIGKFALSPEGWRDVGRRIAGAALPTVIVQEGGYAIDRLGEYAVAFLKAFRSDNTELS